MTLTSVTTRSVHAAMLQAVCMLHVFEQAPPCAPPLQRADGACGLGAALNVSSFLLLGRTSALTMNVGGVLKDWLLIGLSAALFRAAVTATNLAGYGLAFAGVFWYNLQKVRERARADAEAPAKASDAGEEAALLDAGPSGDAAVQPVASRGADE